jgi:Excreted virulence factor EspC, type VII ESX diderm
MPEIRVDPGSLRSAGGTARLAGSQLRTLAGEVTAALSEVAGAAPPETSGASTAFAGALETCALAIAEGIGTLGSNAESAASVYEQVDRQAMPASPGRGGPR